MGSSTWGNYEKVKNLVESNGQKLLTTKEEFIILLGELENNNKKVKDRTQIRIKLSCKECGEPYITTIALYKRKGREKLTCNICSGHERWTYERIKETVFQNGGELLTAEEEFYNQLNKGITPIKIKIDVKCNTCETGIRYGVTINKYITSNHRQCKECTSKKLSERISNWNYEQWENDEYRKEISEMARIKISGENNPRYNPNLTDEEREIQRNTIENLEWRVSVFEKDNYTCQVCGDNKGHNLNAHHLNGYHWAIDQRYYINNGITLCENCHIGFHKEFGYLNNTKEQFEEYNPATENKKGSLKTPLKINFKIN